MFKLFALLPSLPTFLSYSAALLSNIYKINNLTKNNAEEEVPLFKLSAEDMTQNPLLKDAIVSFDSLKIQDEIGHGRHSQF